MIARPRPWKRAAFWLALLGPLFYLSYGFANWWASTRAAVPSVVFDWERQIPFWAWTIFPYWSINAFYALSLFLGPTRHQVDRHAARLLTVQLLAVACFLAWPLRFSLGQPPVEGAPAFLFILLRGFDQPFNQAPSLHIALAVVLWDWYRQRLAGPGLGWARGTLHAWTLAICASVLTTYQHHFLDIPTGALLGLLCVWLWPLERTVSLPRAWRTAADPRRRALAAAYAAGAVLCLGAALATGGAGLWLGWPAVSLALVALCYAGLGARGFRMDGRGRMHWSARWLYGPYRAMAAVNAWLWTRRRPAASEVRPGLWLGRVPTRAEWERAGRPRLVGMCAELQLPRDADARCIPMLDLVVPASGALRRAALAIDAQRRVGQPVRVCCALGVSRSAAAVVAWLAVREGVDAAEAVVRRARPQVVLGGPWRAALRDGAPARAGAGDEAGPGAGAGVAS